MGIGAATNIRVSNNVGANNLTVAKRAAVLGPCLAIIATLLQAAVLLPARTQWASLYTSDADLVRTSPHSSCGVRQFLVAVTPTSR